MQLSSVKNYTQWTPQFHPCLLQLCVNLTSMNLLVLSSSAVSYARKCPIRSQNRPLLSALPPACWSPKIPWLQFTSCFAHLHPCWGGFEQTPLPVFALSANSQPVLPSNFSTLWQRRPSPFLGWIKKVRNSIPRGSSLGSSVEEENRAISQQEIPMGLSKALDLRECFPGCYFLFPLPFKWDFSIFFFSQGEKNYSWMLTSCLTCNRKKTPVSCAKFNCG